MSFIIRNAKKEDIPDILEILNESILHSTAYYESQPKSIKQQEEWLLKKQLSGMPVIVAESEGKALAFGSYDHFRPQEGYKYTVEHSVYVNQHFRGNGIGKTILNQLIQTARNQKMHLMIAVIDSENETSIQLHKKVGFTESGRLKGAGYKFGQFLDVVFLQLKLSY